MPMQGLIDAQLATRRLSVRTADVVYVKSVFEANEGIGTLFGEHGGELIVATPRSQEARLDRLLEDLRAEIGAVVGAVASWETPPREFER